MSQWCSSYVLSHAFRARCQNSWGKCDGNCVSEESVCLSYVWIPPTAHPLMLASIFAPAPDICTVTLRGGGGYKCLPLLRYVDWLLVWIRDIAFLYCYSLTPKIQQASKTWILRSCRRHIPFVPTVIGTCASVYAVIKLIARFSFVVLPRETKAYRVGLGDALVCLIGFWFFS